MTPQVCLEEACVWNHSWSLLDSGKATQRPMSQCLPQQLELWAGLTGNWSSTVSPRSGTGWHLSAIFRGFLFESLPPVPKLEPRRTREGSLWNIIPASSLPALWLKDLSPWGYIRSMSFKRSHLKSGNFDRLCCCYYKSYWVRIKWDKFQISPVRPLSGCIPFRDPQWKMDFKIVCAAFWSCIF